MLSLLSLNKISLLNNKIFLNNNNHKFNKFLLNIYLNHNIMLIIIELFHHSFTTHHSMLQWVIMKLCAVGLRSL